MEGFIPDPWNIISASAIMGPPFTVMKDEIACAPGDSGIFVRSIGKPRGQLADWRSKSLGNRSTVSVHVVEFPDRYEIHADRFDPMSNPLRHLLFDFSPDVGRDLMVGGLAYFAIRKLAGAFRKE